MQDLNTLTYFYLLQSFVQGETSKPCALLFFCLVSAIFFSFFSFFYFFFPKGQVLSALAGNQLTDALHSLPLRKIILLCREEADLWRQSWVWERKTFSPIYQGRELLIKLSAIIYMLSYISLLSWPLAEVRKGLSLSGLHSCHQETNFCHLVWWLLAQDRLSFSSPYMSLPPLSIFLWIISPFLIILN